MKRASIILLFLAFSLASIAQGTIDIDLAQWKGKKEKTPFDISSVKDNRIKPSLIGNIEISKNKSKKIIFEDNSSVMIQKFVDKQFDEGNEIEVRMEIDVLSVEEVAIKKDKKATAYIFACKFYKENSQLTEPLYTFNARNSIPKKNALKMAMTNYISRSINAAILNFKKSYQKHPEWKKENMNSPTVKIDKSIYFNQFVGGDTIALSGKYNLKPADFAGIVGEDEEDDAYSFFMMTYTIDAEDVQNKISIKIHPKTFFLRSKSWAKKTSESNWMLHQQLLFDLASYHSLLFKKKLEQATLSAGFYKTEINSIYNEISAAYFDEMDQLQSETKFGTVLAKEEEWKQKVAKYLGRE